MSKKSLQKSCAAASQPVNHVEFHRLISILRDLVDSGGIDGIKLNWHTQAFQSGDPRFLILPHIGGAVQENIPTAEMAVLKILVERFH